MTKKVIDLAKYRKKKLREANTCPVHKEPYVSMRIVFVDGTVLRVIGCPVRVCKNYRLVDDK